MHLSTLYQGQLKKTQFFHRMISRKNFTLFDSSVAKQ